jgi:hypothetical protein
MSKKYDRIVARVKRLEKELDLDDGRCLDNTNIVSSFDQAVHALECASVPMSYTSVMENTMNTEFNRDYTFERRKLERALYDAKDSKSEELKKVHNIIGPHPRTPKELVSMIQNGKFKFADEGANADNPDYYCDPVHGLIWVDPDKDADYEGYHKACDKMAKDRDDVLLEIGVLEPAEALKSVKKFKERTYH